MLSLRLVVSEKTGEKNERWRQDLKKCRRGRGLALSLLQISARDPEIAINGGPGPGSSHVTDTATLLHSKPNSALTEDLDRLSSDFAASTTMRRHYTPTLSLMWLSLLLFLPLLVSGHMIEVPASKKECFFEDLHVNDKVCQLEARARRSSQQT